MTSREIAVLATDGVEQVELTAPLKALREADDLLAFCAEMLRLFGEPEAA